MSGRSNRGVGRLGVSVAIVVVLLVVLAMVFVLYTLTTGLIAGSSSVSTPPHNSTHNASVPAPPSSQGALAPGSIFLGLVVLIFAAVVVAIIAQRRRDRLRPPEEPGDERVPSEPVEEDGSAHSPPPTDPLDHML